MVDGRSLTVRLRSEQGRGPSARPGMSAVDMLPDDCKLYVGNLPASMEDEALLRAFERCGPVVSSRVILDKITGEAARG